MSRRANSGLPGQFNSWLGALSNRIEFPALFDHLVGAIRHLTLAQEVLPALSKTLGNILR